jgi:hypothetical protein
MRTNILSLLVLLPLAACANESSDGSAAADSGGFMVGGAPTIERADALGDGAGEPYTGPVVHVAQSPMHGGNINEPIEVFIYADDPETGFGPRTWVTNDRWIEASKRVAPKGESDELPLEKGYVRLRMLSTANLQVQLQGSETQTLRAVYSQGAEVGYCIESRLIERRCNQRGETNCAQKFAADMAGHPGGCVIP